MLNYLWCAMLLIGIVTGCLTGNLGAVSEAFVSSAKEAIELCVMMFGVIGMWMGMMRIAEQGGVMRSLRTVLSPLIRFLFPELPKEHKACEYIATNMAANILGLGWAATPAGLDAMRELDLYANEKVHIQHGQPSEVKAASDEMCTFLVVNVSSLQLVPVNIIAYRSLYGSVNPTAIVGPAILTTMISTLAGILFCKLVQMRKHRS
ncbi:MAG: nucleoside recognition protein [Lachnospiraceae bacterium]